MTKPYKIGSYRVSVVRDGATGPVEFEDALVSTPALSADLLRRYIPAGDPREHFVLMGLTVKHRVIGLHTISVGCLTSSLVHPREVFRPAILMGAAAIVVCHNHPSGDPEPSAEDLALTRRLTAAGTLLGIEVLDHVILGDETGTCKWKYVSLKERGAV